MEQFLCDTHVMKCYRVMIIVLFGSKDKNVFARPRGTMFLKHLWGVYEENVRYNPRLICAANMPSW